MFFVSSSELMFAAPPDGYVVKVDSPSVYLDWGTASGLARGAQFSAYRAGVALKHPVTGEVLGNSQTDLGSGVIESVAEKFSIGRILQEKADWKAGDRVRVDVAMPLATPVVTHSSKVKGPTLTEIWRSDPLAGNPQGIAIGDVDADGKADVVVASTNRIEVFSSKSNKLEKVASYANRKYSQAVAVEVGNPAGSGKNKIFATYYQEGLHRSRVLVLELVGSDLKQTADFNGFVRAFPRLDGTRPLWQQDLAMSRDLRVNPPTLVTFADGKYKAKEEVNLPQKLNDDQLFGYAFGDWDDDGAEDWAYLHKGERLRVFFKNLKWVGPDLYGGTKSGFTYDNGKDNLASVYSRLVTWTPKGGTPQLLVSRNKPEMGIRFTYLKVYKEAEIVGFGWNGTELVSQWRLPIDGYLSDFQVGDVMGSGTAQVWAATGAPDSKTVLIGYALPQ